MEIQKFTGYVEKTFSAGNYDQEIVVANYKGEDGKAQMIADFKEKKSKEYPIALRFKASTKNGAADQLKGVCVGDKVEVQFAIGGTSGVSKKTGQYYCINQLNIVKNNGLVLIERGEQNEQEDAGTDDLPF